MTMNDLQLLKGKDYEVTKYLSIHQPKLGEICDYGESSYFSMVYILTSIPSDMKSYLYDNGVDYEKVSEWNFFCNVLRYMIPKSNSILFGKDIDFKSLQLCYINHKTSLCYMLDENTIDKRNVIIQEPTYILMIDYIRKIHNFKKNVEKAGNAFTKKFLIDEDRQRKKDNQNKQFESILYPLILAMINCADCKYNHETIWNLPISVFTKSILQIQKSKNINYTMQGIYSGNIDPKKISSDDLKWF